jgi:hypothetical protein
LIEHDARFLRRFALLRRYHRDDAIRAAINAFEEQRGLAGILIYVPDCVLARRKRLVSDDETERDMRLHLIDGLRLSRYSCEGER